MLFRRLILSAVTVGLVAGALLGIGQQFTTSPPIAAAEKYEHSDHHAETAGHEHAHEDKAWAPSDGAERIVFTILADVCVAIGFGILMLVAMYVARSLLGTPMGPGYGALWGLAAFAVIFVAPALGLPPEVPGTAAAPLSDRQLWWLVTALVAAVAIALLVFAPGWKKLPALVLLPLPYLYGAPEPAGAPFAGHDAAAAQALEQIHHQFIIASGLTNAVFLIVLGVACGWAMRRWVLDEYTDRAPARPVDQKA